MHGMGVLGIFRRRLHLRGRHSLLLVNSTTAMLALALSSSS